LGGGVYTFEGLVLGGCVLFCEAVVLVFVGGLETVGLRGGREILCLFFGICSLRCKVT